MRPRRPALRYHGGKFKLRDWIVDLMPEHEIYVESFGGAASVLLAKRRSFGEVYNDLDRNVVRFFRVLRDPAGAERLRGLLLLTPFAREEYEAARAADLAVEPDDIEAARQLCVRSFMSHGSEGTMASPTGFRSFSWSSNRPASRDWMVLPASLEAITARLQGVVIENRPAIEVMRQHDGPGTLHYVDPPYLPETRSRIRGYKHELSREDHVSLAAVLRGLAGVVMLSGYPSPLYEELYSGWHRVERSARANGAHLRTEVLWSNRPLGRQLSLAGGGG